MKQIRNVVGPQVRKIRDSKGLTQEQLAAQLQVRGWDVSRTSLAKIEAQLRWVADCELYMLAEALDVELHSLFPTKAVVRGFVGSPEFKRN